MSDDVELAILQNLDLFNEFTVNELETIWEHTFQNVDENAGDGITSKFFEYSAGATRDGPDVELGEGEWIKTKDVGKYGAGKPAQPGAAIRYTKTPTGDQDGWVAYYDQASGIGGGVGYQVFSEGEDGANSAGAQLYTFLETGGEGRMIVPQDNWNLHRVPDLDPTDGFLVRWPHAAYGHARLGMEIGVKTDWEDADIDVAGDAFKLYPVHVFTDQGETMWDRFNLPIEWRATGSVGDDFAVRATACHYEGERGRRIKRTNGDGFTPQKNDGSMITLNGYPNWTYLLSFQKRAGWGGVDITPLGFSINADQNIEVQITVGGDFDDTSYGLPEDTSTEETAVEYDIKTWDLVNDQEKTTDTTIGTGGVGEREYYDTIPGDKQTPVSISQQLENTVVTSSEPIALLARPATGTSTVIRYAALRNGGSF
jgi:hypothetical protein